MLEKIKQTITKYGLLKQNERVIVGLSGGPDSTALAVTLAQIAPSISVQLIIAHLITDCAAVSPMKTNVLPADWQKN